MLKGTKDIKDTAIRRQPATVTIIDDVISWLPTKIQTDRPTITDVPKKRAVDIQACHRVFW